MKGIFNNPKVLYFKLGILQTFKNKIRPEDEIKIKLMKRLVKMWFLQR